MNPKNLTLDVESIALALSEEGGYEYYDIDDELKELAKNVSDMQAENEKLRELVRALLTCATDGECDECRMNGATPWHVGKARLCDGVWEHLCELGIKVDE